METIVIYYDPILQGTKTVKECLSGSVEIYYDPILQGTKTGVPNPFY